MTTPAQSPVPGPERIRTPAALAGAAVLVALEGVALVVFGVLETASIEADRVTMGVTTALFFAAYGVALGVLAWLLYRLRSWTRAPVVLAQLIQLGVAWSFRTGGTATVSVVLTVVSVLVLAGVFHPASMRALAEHDGQEAS